jgi:hypothetical protein
VTARALIHKLQTFKGRQIKDVADQIAAIAIGYRVNVMDPEINNRNSIDNESDRLNVRTDKDSVITSFTIG